MALNKPIGLFGVDGATGVQISVCFGFSAWIAAHANPYG